VPFREIIYLEAQSQYTTLRTVDNIYKFNDTISKVEKLLPREYFVRCHRSYIVNLEHIQNHTATNIQFDNGERALISRTLYKDFKERYIAYVKSNAFRGR
jgi:DNA-binding LytR/AlgR family response regulator